MSIAVLVVGSAFCGWLGAWFWYRMSGPYLVPGMQYMLPDGTPVTVMEIWYRWHGWSGREPMVRYLLADGSTHSIPVVEARRYTLRPYHKTIAEQALTKVRRF